MTFRTESRIAIDGSLDRHHLDVADALDPVLEQAGGDRAHDAREVDLDPHHCVGLPVAGRLEFHSPACLGRTHRPGERQVVGRLDHGHRLAPAARQPEHQLRPLLYETCTYLP